MSPVVPLSGLFVFLTLCSSAIAQTAPTTALGNALVAIYLDNDEADARVNPVVVVDSGTQIEIVTAIAKTLTNLEYPDAKLCVSPAAYSDHHLDIRMGIAITDGRAELFIGPDFPLSFVTGLTEPLSQVGVKDIRLSPANDLSVFREEPAPSRVSDSSDPFAAPTNKRRTNDAPFNS